MLVNGAHSGDATVALSSSDGSIALSDETKVAGGGSSTYAGTTSGSSGYGSLNVGEQGTVTGSTTAAQNNSGGGEKSKNKLLRIFKGDKNG